MDARSSTALAAPALVCAPASGHGYPAKAVRLIVPCRPGGGSDIIARPVARQLDESMGQQVVVDNRGGGSGVIGMEHAANSPNRVRAAGLWRRRIGSDPG